MWQVSQPSQQACRQETKTEALRLTEETWHYLHATNMCMHVEPSDSEELEASADESYAPRADRSRMFRDVIVQWASQRQPLTSINPFAPEVNAAVTGVQLGLGTSKLLRSSCTQKVKLKLSQHNMASVRPLTHEVTSWRTRHHGVKEAWMRDMINIEDIQVGHERGIHIRADSLTKLFPRKTTYNKLQ